MIQINRHLLKKLQKLLLVVVCLSLLSGCWDEREIESRTSVSAIAIDKTKTGELLVTVQIPIPMEIAGGGGGGSGGGGGGKPVLTIDGKGKTFDEALNRIQYSVNHNLFFGQTDIVAFSQDAAASGVSDVIDSLRRMSQIRRRLYPVVVKKGKAAELLKISTDLEKIPAKFLQTMIENSVRLGSLPNLTLGRFYIGLSNTAKQPAMLCLKVDQKGNVIESGVAVFKGVKMVGLLNLQDVSNLLRLTGHNGGGRFTFPLGKKNHFATFDPKLAGVKYRFNTVNGRVHADVNVNMEGGITEVTYPLNFNNNRDRKKLKMKMEKFLTKNSYATVRKLQKYDTDILGFGTQIRAYHPKMWNQINWKKSFPNAKVSIHYHVAIRRTGMEMKNQNG